MRQLLDDGPDLRFNQRRLITDIQPTHDASDEAEQPHRVAGMCLLLAGFLVVVTGLLAAFGKPSWTDFSHRPGLTFALVGSLPFFVAGAMLIKRRSILAAGAGNGLAWITIIGALLVTVVGLIAAVSSLALPIPPINQIAELAVTIHEGMPSSGYVVITVLFFMSFVLITTTRDVRRANTDGSTGDQWRSGWMLVWMYAIVGTPLLVALMHHDLKAWSDNNAIAEKNYAAMNARVRQALRGVQRCLLLHKQQHPADGFPDSATSATGNPCVDSAKTRAPFSKLEVRYLPVADKSGHTSGFWLVAEPRTGAQWTGENSADEKGMVYGTDGKAMETPASALENMSSWIEQYKKDKGAYPAVIDGLYGVKIHDVARRPDGTLSMAIGADGAITGAYTILYHPRISPTDSTRALHYTMEARPATYGVDGIRSYFVDVQRQIHWTAFDRPATAKDSLVTACDLQKSSCPSRVE
jgi:hypothetical protein